jgi:hypothetical protein
LSFLLDTNVVSEIRRRRDPRVRAWAEEVDDVDLHLSVLTLGEIRKGTELLRGRDPAQAEVSPAGLTSCTHASPTGSFRSMPASQRSGDDSTPRSRATPSTA